MPLQIATITAFALLALAHGAATRESGEAEASEMRVACPRLVLEGCKLALREDGSGVYYVLYGYDGMSRDVDRALRAADALVASWADASRV